MSTEEAVSRTPLPHQAGQCLPTPTPTRSFLSQLPPRTLCLSLFLSLLDSAQRHGRHSTPYRSPSLLDPLSLSFHSIFCDLNS
jgi:hypothetical protein